MEHMRKSRLSHYKQNRLIEHFVSGLTALTATRFKTVCSDSAVQSVITGSRISAVLVRADKNG